MANYDDSWSGCTTRFVCEFPNRFASSRLQPGMGVLLCLLRGAAPLTRESITVRPPLAHHPRLLDSAGKRASRQQVRRVPQTCRRMVAIPSDRNFRRRISVSIGQIVVELKKLFDSGPTQNALRRTHENRTPVTCLNDSRGPSHALDPASPARCAGRS